MKLLLKQVIISDIHSPHNGQQKDILISDGKISEIGDGISKDDAQEIAHNNMVVSPGWVDPFVHFCDPGFEFRETIEGGAAAAAAGGFTTVFTVPNTAPALSGKSQVEYVIQKSASLPVKVLPLGAITSMVAGKDLAEIYDMRNSNAVAFSDGLQPVQSAGLFVKALQYVKAFDGVIVQMPVDKSMSKSGLMSEGIVSTQLGLPGLPEIAEELMISRDIELTKYCSSRLHITGVSTAKGIATIAAAKKDGVSVTCSVTPYHLFFCDEDLITYDTNLKVDPPLRSRENMMALRNAVIEGKVDCIASHHIPHDWDHKVCEFEYAGMGMAAIQSSFPAINSILPQLSNEQLTQLFSHNARTIFNLPQASITKGGKAELTLFNRTQTVVLTPRNMVGKAVNNPFVDIELTGKVIGIINGEHLYLTN